MLVDEAIVHVRSGRGGDGVAHFRREKFIPKGGPDGGDGGDGGDVVLVADAHLDTLLSFVHQPHRRASDGEPGSGSDCHGRKGADCVVPVPLGTLIFDEADGALIADLSDPGVRLVVARGGRGGLGNLHFKSSTNQAPRECTAGGPAIERTLRLELKLIADIGIVGLPNAGKSTLLRATSRATPKVAAYPFTTLTPQVGVAELVGDRRLVLADIPGLIEGAAAGAGLGHDFLRHIERTRALLHLVDVAPLDGSDPAENYRTVRGELAGYSAELSTKPELVVLNKIDLVPDEERSERIAAIAKAIGLAGEPCVISGAARENIAAMLERCWTIAEKRTHRRWGEADPGAGERTGALSGRHPRP
ncbi:MAG TPA: GTPase ObgE [Phycisphaerales bacterium]|nr:GTPase ObgE [Phycisphaerales bacterium]HMP38133.1 GTPase ObgE [Phycisphaerales bacterium]